MFSCLFGISAFILTHTTSDHFHPVLLSSSSLNFSVTKKSIKIPAPLNFPLHFALFLGLSNFLFVLLSLFFSFFFFLTASTSICSYPIIFNIYPTNFFLLALDVLCSSCSWYPLFFLALCILCSFLLLVFSVLSCSLCSLFFLALDVLCSFFFLPLMFSRLSSSCSWCYLLFLAFDILCSFPILPFTLSCSQLVALPGEESHMVYSEHKKDLPDTGKCNWIQQCHSEHFRKLLCAKYNSEQQPINSLER